MAHPWDQLRYETPQAYEAFLLFRSLGEARTVKETWKRLYPHRAEERPNGTIQGWVKRYRWFDRARAWDSHLRLGSEKQQKAEYLARREKSRDRRGEMLNALAAVIGMHLKAIENGKRSAMELRALSTLIDTYMTQSRKEYGDEPQAAGATTNVNVNLQEVVENARRKLDDQRARIAARLGAAGDPQSIQ